MQRVTAENPVTHGGRSLREVTCNAVTATSLVRTLPLSLQQVPRWYGCAKKKVTPLESSHGHHVPVRAASARAARGRCFDPKRAATAPGCRACSASPEHRVGSLLIVGQDQTQAHSRSSTRGSSSPDDGSHIHRIVRP